MMASRHHAAALTYEPLVLGEGAMWWSGRLYLVDIVTGRLFTVADRPDNGPAPLEVLAQLDVPLGAAVPLAGQPGRWLVAAGTGVAVLEPPDGIEWLGRPEDGAVVPMRMNDATADPSGRLWAGSMAWDAVPRAGSLYRVDGDRRITKVLGGITIPNGPAFGAAGDYMYLADSAAGVIDRVAIDPDTGEVGDRSRFVAVEGGFSPDGMTIDAEGAVWVAVWGSGGVRRYLPDGRLDAVVELPASQPTSVCLGGPDLRRLYMTTATEGLAQPGAGDGLVYVTTVEVPGTATWPARLTDSR